MLIRPSELEPLKISHPIPHLRWNGLEGSSLALALCHLAEQYPHPIVVIGKNWAETQQWFEAAQCFAPLNPTFSIDIFPDWETLPYDAMSASEELVSQRIGFLKKTAQWTQGLCFISIHTLMQRLPPLSHIRGEHPALRKGQHYPLETLKKDLLSAGYHSVPCVTDYAEFAFRGHLVDLFPTGAEYPYRIEFFDDEIESLWTFEPETQRRIQEIEGLEAVLPAREFGLSDAHIRCFREQWRQKFEGSATQYPMYQSISDGLAPPGTDYFFPLFFQHTALFFDYLPPSTLMVQLPELLPSAQEFWQNIDWRYESLRHDRLRPVLPPQELYLRTEEVWEQLNQHPCIQMVSDTASAHHHFNCPAPPPLLLEPKKERPAQALEQFLNQSEGPVIFCAESAGRREMLLSLLQQWAIHPHIIDHWSEALASQERFHLWVADLREGAVLTPLKCTLIGESQLFGTQFHHDSHYRRSGARSTHQAFKSILELSEGDAVVHVNHGIARYRGLKVLPIDQEPMEFLTLEYANEDVLYVPVTDLHLISKYSALDPSEVGLHLLGREKWNKEKQKAIEHLRDVAAELLDLYARRSQRATEPLKSSSEDYLKFAEAFPHEETPDQQRAIDEVINDLSQPKPMDRLVCGDVGFGKTEVAMRAAFISAHAGKQVAVLVPTTLLAEQHGRNFQDRFADWPIRIEVLSRFRTEKETQHILKQLAEGTLDIVVGTHKLLQKDISFKRLGLLIIDEEHRFGVDQKEKLKNFRSNVHVLTMTATPIPRTLYWSLSGLRDLSMITTPPRARLPIKTIIGVSSPELLREACQRELMRSGQIFFVHNEVKDIEQVAQHLRELMPELNIAVAHGQMNEANLERIMVDFSHHRYHILVCTTVIEAGIDIPNANTIIIDHAHELGLAQLYQLRGRVGRSSRQAYAYLLTKHEEELSREAHQRMEAMLQTEQLGTGFQLASQDLEIRGMGEMLGHQQSGHTQLIGHELYLQLLEKACQDLKKGIASKDLDFNHFQCSVELHAPALLPEPYVAEVSLRLQLYKRMSESKQASELEALKEELLDRFGPLPEPTQHLIHIHQLRLHTQSLGIIKMDLNVRGGTLEFSSPLSIDPMKIISLIQKGSPHYRMKGAHSVYVQYPEKNPAQRLQWAQRLLSYFEGTITLNAFLA